MKNTLEQNQKLFRQLRALVLMLLGIDGGVIAFSVVVPVSLINLLGTMITLVLLLPLAMWFVMVAKTIKKQKKELGK